MLENRAQTYSRLSSCDFSALQFPQAREAYYHLVPFEFIQYYLEGTKKVFRKPHFEIPDLEDALPEVRQPKEGVFIHEVALDKLGRAFPLKALFAGGRVWFQACVDQTPVGGYVFGLGDSSKIFKPVIGWISVDVVDFKAEWDWTIRDGV